MGSDRQETPKGPNRKVIRIGRHEVSYSVGDRYFSIEQEEWVAQIRWWNPIKDRYFSFGVTFDPTEVQLTLGLIDFNVFKYAELDSIRDLLAKAQAEHPASGEDT